MTGRHRADRPVRALPLRRAGRAALTVAVLCTATVLGVRVGAAGAMVTPTSDRSAHVVVVPAESR